MPIDYAGNYTNNPDPCTNYWFPDEWNNMCGTTGHIAISDRKTFDSYHANVSPMNNDSILAPTLTLSENKEYKENKS